MDFQQYYESRKKLVNNFLEKRMEKRGISNVDDAMKYSLLAGGKRLRPILLMATADAVWITMTTAGGASLTTKFTERPWRCWRGTGFLPWLLK